MRRAILLAALPLAVAACDHEAKQETQTTVTKNGVTTTTITDREVDSDSDHGATATASSGLSIDSDKFKANVEIPGLSFGAEHMDLDGMKLYPGTTVKGMHVHAVDRPGVARGQVVIDYSAPAAPLAVAQHMANEAKANGFALTANTAAVVSGHKAGSDGQHSFDMTLNPNGSGTVGTLTMTGSGRASED